MQLDACPQLKPQQRFRLGTRGQVGACRMLRVSAQTQRGEQQDKASNERWLHHSWPAEPDRILRISHPVKPQSSQPYITAFQCRDCPKATTHCERTLSWLRAVGWSGNTIRTEPHG